MKDVLLYIAQQIAQEPEQVQIEEKADDGQIEFYVTCAQDDIGRIIGKKGKIIKAIRKILAIMAMREGKRVTITMVHEAEAPTETS